VVVQRSSQVSAAAFAASHAQHQTMLEAACKGNGSSVAAMIMTLDHAEGEVRRTVLHTDSTCSAWLPGCLNGRPWCGNGIVFEAASQSLVGGADEMVDRK